MHQGNREWLQDMQHQYGRHWKEKDQGVLEIGSASINGSAREFIISERYIGIDKNGDSPYVDVICDGLSTKFAKPFSCLLCTSVLEHEPRWRELLAHNMQWVDTYGFLLLSWGAEGNLHHEPEPWAPVPVGDVLEFLATPRVHILEAGWEKTKYTSDCQGCYNLVARLL